MLLHSSSYIYFYLKDILVVVIISEKGEDEKTYIEHSAHDRTSVYPDCTSVELDNMRPDLYHDNNRDRPNNRMDLEHAMIDLEDNQHLVCNFVLTKERLVSLLKYKTVGRWFLVASKVVVHRPHSSKVLDSDFSPDLFITKYVSKN